MVFVGEMPFVYSGLVYCFAYCNYVIYYSYITNFMNNKCRAIAMNNNISGLENKPEAIQKSDFSLVEDISSKLLNLRGGFDLEGEEMDIDAINKCIAHIRKTDKIADGDKLERKNVFSFFHKQISPEEQTYSELYADKTFNPDAKIEYIRETFAPQLRDLRYKKVKEADFDLVKEFAGNLLGLEENEIDSSAINNAIKNIRLDDTRFKATEGKPISRSHVISYFQQELSPTDIKVANTPSGVRKDFQKQPLTLMQRLTSWFNAITSNDDNYSADESKVLPNIAPKNMVTTNKHEEFKLVQGIAAELMDINEFDNAKIYKWIKDQKKDAGFSSKSFLTRADTFKLFKNAIDHENGNKDKVKQAFVSSYNSDNIPLLTDAIKVTRVSGEFSKGSANSASAAPSSAIVDRGVPESLYNVGESDMSYKEFEILLEQHKEKNKKSLEQGSFDSVPQRNADRVAGRHLEL